MAEVPTTPRNEEVHGPVMRGDGVPVAPGMLDAIAAGVLKVEGAGRGLSPPPL